MSSTVPCFRVCLLIICCSGCCPAQLISNTWLQEQADLLRTENRLIGVGTTVLINGETRASVVSGKRIQGTDVMLTVDDKWHVGSITKSMTATMIARLVEQNRLTWDAPLPLLLPDMAAEMHEGWKDVTLHHLLCHTAGLPANFPLKTQFIRPVSREARHEARKAALAEMLTSAPANQPGTEMVYSNAGYTLAGFIAAIRQSSTWEDLMEQEVFGPLKLSTAGFGPPQGKEPHDQPWGHQRAWFLRARKDPRVFADNSPVIGPAGIVHMSMNDLARYGWTHLHGETTSGVFLAIETRERLHTGVIDDYAYGWVEWNKEWAGGRVLWHNGSNTFWYALLVLLPAHDTVIVIVTNDGDVRTAEPAFASLAETIAARLDDETMPPPGPSTSCPH